MTVMYDTPQPNGILMSDPSRTGRRRSSGAQPKYADRIQAGLALARKLRSHFQGRRNTAILAISKAGLVVANTVGQELNLPVGVFYVRQIRCPSQPRLSLGAMTSGELCSLNEDIVKGLHLPTEAIRQAAEATYSSIEEDHTDLHPRHLRVLQQVLSPSVAHSTLDPVQHLILIDDGIVAGDDIRSAVDALRRARSDLKITVATPIGVADTMKMIARRVEMTVTAFVPSAAYTVPSWYETGTALSPEETDQLTH
ncbi:hypothetical protein H4R33_004945 [Dimargaris cristalligena]|uniref:Uncharacterized protein n=1 Tax=Dimargaris cristalligena TaxID=215637 RepID=A0A4V1J4U2_9FUNG|nr:hypothetical protein H4R33_004945 [Dimargaris cristalligena]RKP36749.1 hypothetical protein BJ085DRAFT_38367 [Dimargaris cristalligena]|eukprot:RKP36749.1 hypothetical protein BJ085DRAFT_38367 [Dimargaris cristalligena]